MSLSFLAMGLLAPAVIAAAAPTYTVTSTSTSTIMSCPATVTVCENTCGAFETPSGGIKTGGHFAVTSPGTSATTTVTVPGGVTTPPAAGTPYVTHSVYSSALTCSGGETVIMSGSTSVVTSATVFEPENCPCTQVINVPATTAPVHQNVGGGGGGATVTTHVVYPSAMTCSGGETITIGGTKTVIQSATTITDCPCTQAKTIYVPGPTHAAGGGSSYVTDVVYPSSVTCTGGETVTISGAPTIIVGPTVITDCPCTIASTVVVPGPTLIVGGTTIGAGVGSSTTGAAVPSGTTSAPRSYETTVDGVIFLVQEQYNYAGVPLTLNTKRQEVIASLDICLKTCADASTCVGTSFNVDSVSCLYFSAILENSGEVDIDIEFATVIFRPGSSSSTNGTAIPSSFPVSNSTASGTSSGVSASGTSASGSASGTSSGSVSASASGSVSASASGSVSASASGSVSASASRSASTSASSTSGSSSGTSSIASVSSKSSSGSSSRTSATGASTSGTSASTTNRSTSRTGTSGTSTRTSSGTTADPSADPSAGLDADITDGTAVNLVAKPTGLVLREAHADKAGSVVRRGGILRRSNAEPASKKVRKAVIEL